jgi:hypothetical protein
MYRGENTFEVMYTREQVHYKEENIMELLLKGDRRGRMVAR